MGRGRISCWQMSTTLSRLPLFFHFWQKILQIYSKSKKDKLKLLKKIKLKKKLQQRQTENEVLGCRSILKDAIKGPIESVEDLVQLTCAPSVSVDNLASLKSNVLLDAQKSPCVNDFIVHSFDGFGASFKTPIEMKALKLSSISVQPEVEANVTQPGVSPRSVVSSDTDSQEEIIERNSDDRQTSIHGAKIDSVETDSDVSGRRPFSYKGGNSASYHDAEVTGRTLCNDAVSRVEDLSEKKLQTEESLDGVLDEESTEAPVCELKSPVKSLLRIVLDKTKTDQMVDLGKRGSMEKSLMLGNCEDSLLQNVKNCGSSASTLGFVEDGENSQSVRMPTLSDIVVKYSEEPVKLSSQAGSSAVIDALEPLAMLNLKTTPRPNSSTVRKASLEVDLHTGVIDGDSNYLPRGAYASAQPELDVPRLPIKKRKISFSGSFIPNGRNESAATKGVTTRVASSSVVTFKSILSTMHKVYIAADSYTKEVSTKSEDQSVFTSTPIRRMIIKGPECKSPSLSNTEPSSSISRADSGESNSMITGLPAKTLLNSSVERCEPTTEVSGFSDETMPLLSHSMLKSCDGLSSVSCGDTNPIPKLRIRFSDKGKKKGQSIIISSLTPSPSAKISVNHTPRTRLTGIVSTSADTRMQRTNDCSNQDQSLVNSPSVTSVHRPETDRSTILNRGVSQSRISRRKSSILARNLNGPSPGSTRRQKKVLIGSNKRDVNDEIDTDGPSRKKKLAKSIIADTSIVVSRVDPLQRDTDISAKLTGAPKVKTVKSVSDNGEVPELSLLSLKRSQSSAFEENIDAEASRRSKPELNNSIVNAVSKLSRNILMNSDMVTDEKIATLKYLTEVANCSRQDFYKRMQLMHNIAKQLDNGFNAGDFPCVQKTTDTTKIVEKPSSMGTTVLHLPSRKILTDIKGENSDPIFQRCVECLRNGIVDLTTCVFCDTCDVALCIVPCFKAYHSAAARPF